MKIRVKKGTASGTVLAPPSKSYSHRILIGAALADGTSKVENLAFSEDILATIDSLKSLGADFEIKENTVCVMGCGGKIKNDAECLCRESGSTLRFLIPLSRICEGESAFLGTERLLSRGIGIYEDVLPKKGVFIKREPDKFVASGKLLAGDYIINGNVSSQFITGMMFALPLLEGESKLTVLPPFESKSYVGITADALGKFGIKILPEGNGIFNISGGQKYIGTDLSVEGDWSNAAFLYALKYLGGDVNVEGLNANSLQGDRICVDMFDKIVKGYSVIDVSDCPDLAPVLFAAAAANRGARFIGTKRLSIKESDRAAAMAEELSKFGVKVKVEENSVEVQPSELKTPEVEVCGHNDHRIVMAMFVLGTLTGAVINGAEAVRKSYPDFFEQMISLGLEITDDT